MLDLSNPKDREALEELISDLLHYDPETGLFTWKVKRKGTNGVGSIAGKTDTYGYVQITIDGNVYLAHRLAWFIMTGKWPENEVDHKDTIKNNNKWENLREADDSQNGANRNIYSNNKSGIKGVCWHKASNKWLAQIRKNKKCMHLGLFSDINDAAKAYEKAAKNLHKNYHRVSTR